MESRRLLDELLAEECASFPMASYADKQLLKAGEYEKILAVMKRRARHLACFCFTAFTAFAAIAMWTIIDREPAYLWPDVALAIGYLAVGVGFASWFGRLFVEIKTRVGTVDRLLEKRERAEVALS